MFRLSLKNIWSRKGRLVLTALAVIAGTAFLSGVFVFTDTIKGSFNTLFANAYASTDSFVRSSDVIVGEFGDDLRASFDGSVVDVVAAVPGVKAAQADVNGTASITNAEGKIIGGDGPPQFGRAWHDGAPSPWTLKDGRGPTTDTEVVVDAASAKKGDVEVGEIVTITTEVATRTFTVVGLALFAGQEGANGVTFALFDLPIAQEFVLGEAGKIDFISVAGDGSKSEAELTETIRSAVGSGAIEVLTGQGLQGLLAVGHSHRAHVPVADQLDDAVALDLVVLDHQELLQAAVDELAHGVEDLAQRVLVRRLGLESQGALLQRPLRLVRHRDHVDGDVAGRGIVLQPVEHAPAVHVGQADVQGDRARLQLPGQGQRGGAA